MLQKYLKNFLLHPKLFLRQMGLNYSLPGTIFFQIQGFIYFTQAGYQRNSRNWDPKELEIDLSGKVYIVTGGNSGIGFTVCEELLKRNATVLMLCRNKEKGEQAIQSLKESTNVGSIELHLVDVSRPDQIKQFCIEFLNSGRNLNCLINNAGVLLSDRSTTPDGIEATFATNTLGTFLLTEYLLPALKKSAPSRVVVVSSGGMYTQKMNATDFQNQAGVWDGLRAYAQTKRQQIYLTETWANKYTPSTQVTFNSMHPGWTRTPGAINSLPSWFNSLDLRTPIQGADTILYLAMSPKVASETGKFWFDREAVPTHMPLAKTESTSQEIQQLYNYCEKYKTTLD